MTDMGRPAWVDDELFPFASCFVAIDGHTVRRAAARRLRGSTV
jgi:hypothetical protein